MFSFIWKFFLNNLPQAFSFCLGINNIDIIFLQSHLSLFLPVFFSFFKNHIFQFFLPPFCLFSLFFHLLNLLQLFLFNSLQPFQILLLVINGTCFLIFIYCIDVLHSSHYFTLRFVF